MTDHLDRALASLRGATCTSVDAEEYEEPAKDSVYSVGTVIHFSEGTRLRAQFWRLLENGMPRVSIFDHRQRYGLPEPVDAITVLRGAVLGKAVAGTTMLGSGDLRFQFSGEMVVEVFNFTAFEIWEIRFPDGAVEYSNYALAK